MAKRGKDFKINAPIFDFAFLNHLGAAIKDEYKDYTFNQSNPKMANRQPFPKYSKGYEKQKSKGRVNRRSVRGGYANSKAPVASGALMLNLKHKANVMKQEIDLGWDAEAYKVKHLRNMKSKNAPDGRILTSSSNAISDDVIKKIMPLFNKHLKKTMPKGTQTITIGKK